VLTLRPERDRHSASCGSYECAVANQPAGVERGDFGDALIIAVVVDELDPRALGGRRDEQVRRRDPAMGARGGQRELDLASPYPRGGRRGHRDEGVEASGGLVRACLARGEAGELEGREIADQHRPAATWWLNQSAR